MSFSVLAKRNGAEPNVLTLVTFVPFPTIKIITQTLQSNSILQLLVKM